MRDRNKEVNLGVFFLDNCSEQVCVHLPKELLLAAKDISKEKGYRSVPKYMAALLCMDLIHEISDWSVYQETDD